MHVTCSAFLSSSALTIQYDHSKHTLDYILVTPSLETVEVVCTL